MENIVPAFSTPIGVFKIKESLNFYNIKNYKFKKIFSEDVGNNCFITESKKILNDYETEKKIIYNYLNYYLKGILKFTDVDFSITSSWATKLEKNSHSHRHDHKNCYLTGVLFFDEFYAQDSGLLEIYSPYEHLSSYEFLPTEINEYNTKVFSFVPEKNLLVLFPSYLKHATSPNFSNCTRYSIAFNVIPVGVYGVGDNLTNLKYIEK